MEGGRLQFKPNPPVPVRSVEKICVKMNRFGFFYSGNACHYSLSDAKFLAKSAISPV